MIERTKSIVPTISICKYGWKLTGQSRRRIPIRWFSSSRGLGRTGSLRGKNCNDTRIFIKISRCSETVLKYWKYRHFLFMNMGSVREYNGISACRVPIIILEVARPLTRINIRIILRPHRRSIRPDHLVLPHGDRLVTDHLGGHLEIMRWNRRNHNRQSETAATILLILV